jgi:DDE family transposase
MSLETPDKIRSLQRKLYHKAKPSTRMSSLSAYDFVILSRGYAHEALTWTRAVMTKLGLTLNEAKTSVKNARREGFDFPCGYQAPKFRREIVKHSDTAKGFEVLPRRWVVERTFAWLNRCRRLSKDFENRTCNALNLSGSRRSD